MDYREEAAQDAFPNIQSLDIKVRIRENSELWVVNASELEKALKIDPPTWSERNGLYIVFAIYGLLYLAGRFHWLPASFFQPWY